MRRFRTEFRTEFALVILLSLPLFQCHRYPGFRAHAESATSWEWVEPAPSGNELRGLAYGNGAYVAVADGGTAFASRDGGSWRRMNVGTCHDLHAIVFGAGKFLAVGDSGAVFASADGLRWEQRDAGTSEDLRAIAFGDGLFLAVGRTASYGTRDGAAWTAYPFAKEAGYPSVAFGAGTFVLLSGGLPAFSPDGRSWTPGKVPSAPGHPDESFHLSRVVYAAGMFFASGEHYREGSRKGLILSSRDGRAWTRIDAGVASRNVLGLASSGRERLAFADPEESESTMVLASPDGKTWKRKTAAAGIPRLESYTFAGDRYFALGSENRIYSSRDGSAWESKLEAKRKIGSECHLKDIAYGNGLFVAGGTLGCFCTSRDGMVWTVRNLGFQIEHGRIMYRRGTFVAVNSLNAMYSRDGAVWKSASEERAVYLPVARSRDAYVAVGGLGTIYRSSDAGTWTPVPSGTRANLVDVAFGAGRFIAVGEKGILLASKDGTRWERMDMPGNWDFASVRHGAGRFYATAAWGVVLSSADGLAWTRERTGTRQPLGGTAHGAGRIVAVGDRAVLAAKARNAREKSSGVDSVAGLWAGEDHGSFRVGVVGADGALTYRDAALDSVPGFSYPRLPASSPAPDGFISEGWSVMSKATGDLNGDKAGDIAMILQYRDTVVVRGDGTGLTEARPRDLVILFGKADGRGYTLAGRSTRFIPSGIDPAMEEPFRDMVIKRGNLEFGFGLFMNMGGWSMGNYTYQFRFRGGRFVLIGSTSYESSRNGSHPAVETSCNYLTHRKKTTTSPAGDVDGKPVIEWSRFESGPIGFDDIGDVLNWDAPGESP